VTFLLRRFTCPDNNRLYAKQGPKENQYSKSEDGLALAHRYQNPFCLTVSQSQFADFIWSMWGMECLVSERAYDILQSEGITGIAVEPADVRLMFPHHKSESRFNLMRVVGWGGFAAPSSGLQQVPDPEGLGRLAYAPCTSPEEIFDIRQWDESDFFFIWPMPNYWWVSPLAAEILTKWKLKHYKLASLDQIDFSPLPGGIGFMPGRLQQTLDDDRARGYGLATGIY
jgi:hypothetical protein